MTDVKLGERHCLGLLKTRCKVTVFLTLVVGSGSGSAGVTVNRSSLPPDFGIAPTLSLPSVHDIPFSSRQFFFTDEPGAELLPSLSPPEHLLYKPGLYQKQRGKSLGKKGSIEDSERLLFFFWRITQNQNRSSEQGLAEAFDELSEEEKNSLHQRMVLYFENLIDFYLFGPLLPAGGGEDINSYRKHHHTIPLSLIALMLRLLQEEVLTEKLIDQLKAYDSPVYKLALHSLGKTGLKQVIKDRLWLVTGTGRDRGRGEKSAVEPQDSGRFKAPNRQVNESTSLKAISATKAEGKKLPKPNGQLQKYKLTSYAQAAAVGTKRQVSTRPDPSANSPVGKILFPVSVPADHHCGFHGIARQLAIFNYQTQGKELRSYMSQLWNSWQDNGGQPKDLFDKGVYEQYNQMEPFDDVFYNPWKYSVSERGWLSDPHLFVTSLFFQFYTLVVSRNYSRDKKTGAIISSVWTSLNMPIPKVGGITSFTLSATEKLLKLVNRQDRTLTSDSIQKWIEFQLQESGESSARGTLNDYKDNLESLISNQELKERLDNRPLVILIIDRYQNMPHSDHWSAARMYHEDEDLWKTYRHISPSFSLLPENTITQKTGQLLLSDQPAKKQLLKQEENVPDDSEHPSLGTEKLSQISQLIETFDSLCLEKSSVVYPTNRSSGSTQLCIDEFTASSQSSSYHTASLLSQNLLSEPADTDDFFSLTGEMLSQLVDETNKQWSSISRTQELAKAVIDPYPELVQAELSQIAMDMTQDSINRDCVGSNQNYSGSIQQKLPSGVSGAKGINDPDGGAGRGRGRGTKPVEPKLINPGRVPALSVGPSITIRLPPGRIDNSCPGEALYVTPPLLETAKSVAENKINPGIVSDGQGRGRGRGRGTKPISFLPNVIPVSDSAKTEPYYIIGLVDRMVRQVTTPRDRLTGTYVPYDLFRKLRCLGLYAGDIYLVYLNLYHGICLSPACQEESSSDPQEIAQVFKHPLPIGMLQQWINIAYQAMNKNPPEPLEYNAALPSWFLPGTGVENFDVSRTEEICNRLYTAASLGSLRAAYFYGVLKIRLYETTKQLSHIEHAHILFFNYSLVFSKQNKPESSEYVSLTQSSEYSDAYESVSDTIPNWPQQDKRRFSHWVKQNTWAKQAYERTGEEGYHFQYMDDDNFTDIDDSLTTGDITPRQQSPDLEHFEETAIITDFENKPGDIKSFLGEIEQLMTSSKNNDAYKYLNKWVSSFYSVPFQDFYKVVKVGLSLVKKLYGYDNFSDDVSKLMSKVAGEWEVDNIIELFNYEGIDVKFYVLLLLEYHAHNRSNRDDKKLHRLSNRLKAYLVREWSAPDDMSIHDLVLHVTNLVEDLSLDKSRDRIDEANKWLTFAENKKEIVDMKKKHLSAMRDMFNSVIESGSAFPEFDSLVLDIMKENKHGRPEQAIHLIDVFLNRYEDNLEAKYITSINIDKLYSLRKLYLKYYRADDYIKFERLCGIIPGEYKYLHKLISSMEDMEYSPALGCDYAVRIISNATAANYYTFEVKRALQFLARHSLINNPEHAIFYWQLIVGSNYLPAFDGGGCIAGNSRCLEVSSFLKKVEFWNKEEGIVFLRGKYKVQVLQEAFFLLYVNGYFEQALLIAEYILDSWEYLKNYFSALLGHGREYLYRNQVFFVMMVMYSLTDNNDQLEKYRVYLGEKKRMAMRRTKCYCFC